MVIYGYEPLVVEDFHPTHKRESPVHVPLDNNKFDQSSYWKKTICHTVNITDTEITL